MTSTNKNQPKFEILISTVNNRVSEIGYENVVIINQIFDKKIPVRDVENVYNYYERGLAKSRNRALKHASAEICLIGDDDVCYKKNIEEIIITSFIENPKADVITFQIKTPKGDYYKDYKKEKYWHNTKTLMNVSSVEIAFRREVVLEKNLKFDELFGLGSTFPSGEETIFLTDALKKGLQILYIPEVIGIHLERRWETRWKDKNELKTKGAVLNRILGWKAYFWIFILAVKKFRLSKHSFINFFNHMLNGIREYRNKSKI